MTAIEPWLLAIIANQSGREPGEIAPTSRLVDDLKLDSLDEMEMVIAIEEAKDVVIPTDDWLPEGATVADMAAAVEKIIAGKVLAIAEYGHKPILCTNPGKDADLRRDAERYLLDVVGPHLPVDTIVVDIWLKPDPERPFGLVEINPYGMSDPVGAISYAAIEAGIPNIARHALPHRNIDVESFNG